MCAAYSSALGGAVPHPLVMLCAAVLLKRKPDKTANSRRQSSLKTLMLPSGNGGSRRGPCGRCLARRFQVCPRPSRSGCRLFEATHGSCEENLSNPKDAPLFIAMILISTEPFIVGQCPLGDDSTAHRPSYLSAMPCSAMW